MHPLLIYPYYILGGLTPFLPMGKVCLFPSGEKYIEKRGKRILFLLFPYTLFPWAKMGLDPPYSLHLLIAAAKQQPKIIAPPLIYDNKVCSHFACFYEKYIVTRYSLTSV